MDYITIILTAIYFILPAYFANMSPIFANVLNLPFWFPISKKMFWENKTYRWFISWIIWAILILYLQRYLQNLWYFESYRLLDYNTINIFFYWFLFWFGALFWDLVESFFKRRIGIAPWKPWVPFDQIDLIIWAIIFIYPFYHLEIKYIIVLLIFSPFLHFLVNVIWYKLWFKKVWR